MWNLWDVGSLVIAVGLPVGVGFAGTAFGGGGDSGAFYFNCSLRIVGCLYAIVSGMWDFYAFLDAHLNLKKTEPIDVMLLFLPLVTTYLSVLFSIL